MALDNILKSIQENPKFKQEVNDYFNKIKEEREKEKKKQNFLSKRLRSRFKGNKKDFSKFIKLFQEKYSSKEYVTRWYYKHDKGIEPPESMYFHLYNYAKKYGRKCSKKEWKKYGNIFTSSLYYCQGHYFQVINGQGSAILIDKK